MSPDDEALRPLDISAPFELDREPIDVADVVPRPHPGRRWATAGVAVVVLLGVVGFSGYRAQQRQHVRTSYDQLVILTAAGQGAVENAVSQTRDVVQYAEPQLNQSQTTPAVRTALLAQVSTAARESQAGIDAQRRRLAAASAPGKLAAAKAATLAYLADWSAIFGSASGDASANQQADLAAEQSAAKAALRAAAPDKARADEAQNALGVLGW